MKTTASKRTRRGQDRGEATQQRILEAAVREFAAYGYEGASVRRIAAGAGENVGLIPYYFGSKENLWRAAVDFHFHRLRGYLREADAELKHLPAEARIRENLKRFVRFAARHPEQMRIMVHEGQFHSKRMTWLVDAHLKPLFEDFQRMAAKAVALKLIPKAPPAHYYYAYLGAASNIFTAASECAAVTGTDPFAEESIEAHADFLCRLFFGSE